jgi:hypothetical protein
VLAAASRSTWQWSPSWHGYVQVWPKRCFSRGMSMYDSAPQSPHWDDAGRDTLPPQWQPLAAAGVARAELALQTGAGVSALDARWDGLAGRPRLPGAQWWSATRERARAAIARSPARFYRELRRWSPGVVPPLLGSLLMLLAFAQALQRSTRRPPLVEPSTLLKLFITYLVFGTIYGVLLYLAADDIIWWSVLALGAAVYAIVTAGFIFGLNGAAVVVAVVLALAAWYARSRVVVVPEGKAMVTGIAGGYGRTLLAGRTLLLPFEGVLSALDLTERRFTAPTRRAEIPNPGGEPFVARAAATVAYRLIPAEAHNVLLMSSQWERDLQALIGELLQQALGEWGQQMLRGDTTPPDRLLGRMLLRDLREQVRSWGVHVLWVSVRDIWLAPRNQILPAEPVEDTPSSASAPMHPLLVGADRQLPAPPRVAEAAAQQAGPAPGAPTPSQPETPAPADVLAPEVLAHAYELVRTGQITDPATIRQIARAFVRVAGDPDRSGTLPFDAVAAAQILMERAKYFDATT